MKTSKIILISFLSVVSLFLLSFLITVDGKKYEKNIENAEEAFAQIKVIKACQGADVTVSTDKENQISVPHYKDSTYKMPYEIIGDTLVLKPYKQNERSFHYTVSVNAPVKAFIADGGTITSNVMQDSITIINKNKGQFYIHRDCSISYALLLSQDKSRTVISSNGINKIEMQVNNSNVSINKPIQKVKLEATNNARVTMQRVKSINATCDESSEYKVY